MPLISWQQTLYFDPQIGADAIRYTGFSGHGSYWASEPMTEPGKSRRAQRDRVLDRIEAAIESGAEPGEVRTAGPPPIPKEGAHGRSREDAGIL